MGGGLDIGSQIDVCRTLRGIFQGNKIYGNYFDLPDFQKTERNEILGCDLENETIIVADCNEKGNRLTTADLNTVGHTEKYVGKLNVLDEQGNILVTISKN